MLKKTLILLIISIKVNSTFSQIIVKEVEKNVIIEFVKPPTYDSTKNFVYEKYVEKYNPIENYYLQYIGLKTYIPKNETTIYELTQELEKG